MDQPHLSSQIDYLIQKQQEDQAKIAQLQQRVESQTYELQEQKRHIQRLESELVEAQLAVKQLPQFDKLFANLKKELTQVIEERVDRAQPVATPDDIINTQLENQAKTLNYLQREMNKIHRSDEQAKLARTEVGRLNKSVSTFQASVEKISKQLDERVRPISYLEEQIQANVRRVAELQQEVPDLHRGIENSVTKIQMIEKQIPQFSKYEMALEEMRKEIRQYREHTDFQLAQRERMIRNWNELVEKQEARMEEYENLSEKYIEHYQLNKRALSSLQEFQERLQREQHQTEELQRLAEERLRASIEKWQTDYEQRWQKQAMEWKPKHTGLEDNIEDLKKQLVKIEKFNAAVEEQIEIILQIIEEDIHARVVATQEWQNRFEQLANGQP